MVNSNGSDSSETDYSKDVCPAAFNNSESSSADDDGGEFDWSTSQQGVILGAYFWGFVIAKILGSRAAEIAGQRRYIACATALSGVVLCLSPLAASLGPYVLAAARFLLGALYGPVTSSIPSLLAPWAPRNELASMMTSVFAGACLGSIISYIISGWFTKMLGWRSTFYLGGLLAFILIPPWIILVRNKPEEHPWLSQYERKLLEENKNTKAKKTAPWRKILTSPYVIILIFCYFARIWIDVLMSTEGPAFFTYKIGLSLDEASYACAGYYLATLPFMIFFGRISDFIVKKHYIKRIYARKLFHFIGSGLAACTLIGICLAGCNATAVIVLFALTGAVTAATVCSFTVSVIDVAPTFTGVVMGLFGFGSLGAALAPTLTSYFLNQGNGWNETFYLCAGLNIVACVVYICFMTDEAQPWNFEDEKSQPDN